MKRRAICPSNQSVQAATTKMTVAGNRRFSWGYIHRKTPVRIRRHNVMKFGTVSTV